MSAALVPPPIPPPAELPRTIPPSAAKQEVKDKLYELGSWFLGVLPWLGWFLWMVITHGSWFALMYCMYGYVVANGLANGNDTMARLIHKAVPLFAGLGNTVEWRGLQIAHAAAAGMLIFVTFTWEVIIRQLKSPEPPGIGEMVVYTAGAALLIAEAIYFCKGVRNSSTFGGGSWFDAVVLTVICVCMTVLFAVFVNSQRRKDS